MNNASDYGYRSPGAVSDRCIACGSNELDCCDGTMPARKFRVCVAMSGQHHERGKFDTLEAAKTFQAELHKQGWYNVPIYREGDREPFEYLRITE